MAGAVANLSRQKHMRAEMQRMHDEDLKAHREEWTVKNENYLNRVYQMLEEARGVSMKCKKRHTFEFDVSYHSCLKVSRLNILKLTNEVMKLAWEKNARVYEFNIDQDGFYSPGTLVFTLTWDPSDRDITQRTKWWQIRRKGRDYHKALLAYNQSSCRS